MTFAVKLAAGVPVATNATAQHQPSQPQPPPQQQQSQQLQPPPPQPQPQTSSQQYQQHQYASQPQQVQVQVQVRSPQYQQPQHHQQQQLAMNGINGNMGGAPPMPAGPTPAGHQAELNYIYGMVEELSRQLADNRRVTEDIVNGLGKVRTKAKNQNLSNDELIASAASDLQGEHQRRPHHVFAPKRK